MRAYTFLDVTGRAVLDGRRWPQPQPGRPGPWVTAGGGADGPGAVQACRVEHLAWWLGEELWEVDVDGGVDGEGHGLRLDATRGRLVRRVTRWRWEVAPLLSADAAWRTRQRAVRALADARRPRLARLLADVGALDELAVVAIELGEATDAAGPDASAVALAADAAAMALGGDPGQAPFVAACAAGHERVRRGGGARAFEEAFAAERAHQSCWSASRLGLA